MFETLKNAFKSKDIRMKIFFTLALILVYRIGCYIPLPTLAPNAVENWFSNTGDFFVVLSVITGGAMSNATLFSLGI